MASKRVTLSSASVLRITLARPVSSVLLATIVRSRVHSLARAFHASARAVLTDVILNLGLARTAVTTSKVLSAWHADVATI